MTRLLLDGVDTRAELLTFARDMLSQSRRIVGMKTGAAGPIAKVCRDYSRLTGKL